MALADLTQTAVENAIAEFNELGRRAFLEKYGFGPSRGYFLEKDGIPYDSKAIAGAAHGHLGSGFGALKAQDFSGGEETVAQTLRALGFQVTSPRDRRDEVLPFVRGEIYHRQRDIHQRFGGQERGGVATPSGVPFVFLFTGESGTQFGYADGWIEDGTFSYTGEGQRGDMQFKAGNRAIRDHLANGRDLLLFETHSRKGFYRFVGCFSCAGWAFLPAPDVEGKSRQAIVFQLVPVDEVESGEQLPRTDQGRPLADLRAAAHAAATVVQGGQKQTKRNYYDRCTAVKVYVLARAAGRCEACGNEAPFKRLNGSPYLEPHHTRRLADGGPDSPDAVGAVCPTCHREIHHGQNGMALNEKLMRYLAECEAASI